MSISLRGVATAAALTLAVSGCDKLKSVVGGSAEGGSSSPGILGEVFGTDFEGEITSKLTTAATPGKVQNIVIGIKKPKYRMDMSDGVTQQGSLIIDLPTKKGWMLIHPQKIAMSIDMNQPANSRKIPGMPGAPKGVPTAPTTPPKIEKTGKKDTVAGYSCEIWNISSDGKKSETCMADNLSWIDMSDLGMGSTELAAAAIATEGNRFPLRVITYNVQGKEEMRMEAQSVVKKKLEDARFVPPADYRQMNMGNPLGNLPLPPAKH